MNKNSSLSFSNIFKRETKLAAYFIICLTLVVLSVSYALFFSVTNNTNNQVVEAGDLVFTYKNGTSISVTDENKEKSVCFQPMSDEEAELYWNECSYSFSVRNTGSLKASYSLSLSPLEGSTVDPTKLKVILRKVEEGTKTTQEGYPKVLTTGEVALLTNAELGQTESIEYQIQVYVAEGTYDDTMANQSINYQINGKGIVHEEEDLNPKPFEDPFANPTETVDATTGNGLYAVPHTSESLEEAYRQTEYRYGGVNPNNYVHFNDETWRIIGLVNVKTKEGESEVAGQRLKIVRDEDIGKFAFDIRGVTSTYEFKSTNSWHNASVASMLNNLYFFGTSGSCIVSSIDSVPCDFTGNGEYPRGLNEVAQSMVAQDVIWATGGNVSNGKAEEYYIAERGDYVYDGSQNVKDSNIPTWDNTAKNYHGVGLLYASDYGYATGGEPNTSNTRDYCINRSSVYLWKDPCNNNDWLQPTESTFLMTHNPSSNVSVSYLTTTSGNIIRTNARVYSAYLIKPVVYLSDNVHIVSGSGTVNEMYELAIK